jgi:site-specific DNA-methyltransferase (adenine-specific)
MELMARYPDKYFDLAVADPPYGGPCMYTYIPSREAAVFSAGASFEIYVIKAAASKGVYGSDRIDHGHGKWRNKTREWDFPPSVEYFRELFRVSKYQVVWGGNNFPLPPSRNFIVWRKANVHRKFSMAMVEQAWTNIEGNAIEIVTNAQPGVRTHPTQKPVRVYSEIFAEYTKPGDKVLDTHLGSGTSAIAAIEHNLDFTACEIDREYYEAAQERIRVHQLQGQLFRKE